MSSPLDNLPMVASICPTYGDASTALIGKPASMYPNKENCNEFRVHNQEQYILNLKIHLQ